jgi:hypothetical protein
VPLVSQPCWPHILQHKAAPGAALSQVDSSPGCSGVHRPSLQHVFFVSRLLPGDCLFPVAGAGSVGCASHFSGARWGSAVACLYTAVHNCCLTLFTCGRTRGRRVQLLHTASILSCATSSSQGSPVAGIICGAVLFVASRKMHPALFARAWFQALVVVSGCVSFWGYLARVCI